MDGKFDERQIVRTLKLNQRAIGALKVIERALLSEIAEKINQAANSGAPLSVGARCNHQKTFVCIGRFLIPFGTRGCLTEIEYVIRFVRIDGYSAAQPDDARVSPVFVVVNHGQ